MKITVLTLQVKEYDYNLLEQHLVKHGWVKVPRQHIYRKKFHGLEVEVKEHLPSFSMDVTLHVSAKNPKGIRLNEICKIVEELEQMDVTPDIDED
ncbi:hypothetical protein [Thermoflavimicrobium daqui]|uniref:Uncharacterized protein n=1 Tax=Thermoflavimicrobium daqui TaxID=2137476 RepID=A0A364K6S9_9BACL|nr:hypothetical protein [Thermoflavimicrobium daqui]RAL25900.1 hypothetical protein DL897_07440 [Thermoflavimicrobium daqui]